MLSAWLMSRLGQNPWLDQWRRASTIPILYRPVRSALFTLAFGLMSIFVGVVGFERDSLWAWLVTAVLVVIVPLVTSIVAWRLPTYEPHYLEASELAPGQIYAEDQVASADGSVQYSTTAHLILETFRHHGRDRSVQIALDDGSARRQNPADLVRVLVPKDIFATIRPNDQPHYFANSTSDEVISILGLLWDASAEGYSSVDWSYLVEQSEAQDHDQLSGIVRTAVQTHFVNMANHGLGRSRRRIYELTAAGEIVLLARMRAVGVELDSEAEERALTHINYGNIFNNSPYSSGSTGSGDAITQNHANLDPELAGSLKELVATVQAQLQWFDDIDQSELNSASAVIEAQLESRVTDDSALKSAVRRISRTGGQVVIGALGSGAWTILSTWAGVM